MSDKPEIEVEWPKAGETFADGARRLTVTEVRPGDPLERNVVGVLRELSKAPATSRALNEVLEGPYACSLRVFQTIWKRIE